MVIIRECTEIGSSSETESEGKKSLCMVGSSSMELCLVSLPLKEAIIEDYASSGSSSGIKSIDEPFWDVDSSSSDRSCVALYSNRAFDGLENANMDNRSLLLMMDFSEDLVDLALNRLGENASPTELIDLMLATQPSEHSRETDSAYLSYCEDHKIEASTSEALKTKDKTFFLREMGFNEDEIASAIDTFGSEIPISELADSIFAGRMARVHWEDNEDSFKSEEENVTGDQEGLISSKGPTKRHSDHYPGVSREPNGSCSKDIKGKKPRVMVADERRAVWRSSNDRMKGKTVKFRNSSGCKPSQHNRTKGPRWGASLPPRLRTEAPSSAVSPRNISHLLANLPYFFYGNVVDISSEAWRRLSQFLYGIEPKMVNCKSFSALDRKEGYFHNLPTAERFHILPRPPDRYAVYAGVQDMSPADPDRAERVMGYPLHHTATGGMSPTARLRKLHYSFQTDTLGYHLSALKTMYPLGINVLSIFSGVGGAEVALSRLGIHLKCVVSVEASEACRRVLRRWWQESGQSGELVEAGGIQELTLRKLEGIVGRVGGFDIVIGSSQVCGGGAEGDTIGKSAMDMQLFFEFVRLLQLVRSLQGRRET